MKHQYCECGHEHDEHFDIELEVNCRCLSCWGWTPVQCKHASDPEDNYEGPRCTCTEFIFKEYGPPPYELPNGTLSKGTNL
jgi:hypothetical protein